METSQNAKKIGYIAFDTSLEFVLVQINDDKYDVPVIETTITNKYHEVIAAIKEFMNVFGKKMDCWEQFVEYDGTSFYCIKTDLDDLNIDDMDDYDIIAIDDFNNVECSDRIKWLSYMALDRTMRKVNITKNQD